MATNRARLAVNKNQKPEQAETRKTATLKPTTSTNATKSVLSKRAQPTLKRTESVESNKTKAATKTRTPEATNVSSKTAKTTINKSNTTKTTTTKTSTVKTKQNAVLDTYHNVTVASPPQRRKEVTKPQPEYEQTSPPPPTTTQKPQMRARTLTRTLDPEEVVVLKRESAKQRIQAQIEHETETIPRKNPVAFEVKFDETKRTTTSVKLNNVPAEEETENYSDDFESYESDFETGESTSTPEDDIPSSSASSEESAVEDAEEEDDDDDEDDSEPTQNPITVIQRDKKLDSGHYDMNSHTSHRHPKLANLNSQSSTLQYDSFDIFSMTNSEQLDSGVSSYGNETQVDFKKSVDVNSFFGGYAEFFSRPILTRRGTELARKLQFDCLTYEIFEMKPLSYDSYMQTYGALNTCQTSTQTQALCVTESQTEDVEMRSVWTQHPPPYDLQTMQQLHKTNTHSSLQNDSGEDVNYNPSAKSQDVVDEYEQSLRQLHALHQAESQRQMQRQVGLLRKTTDFERLNSFLHNASLLMSKILNGNGAKSAAAATLMPAKNLVSMSKGYTKLNAGFLNALRVRRIFANEQLIITVHECLPETNVYRGDFANLLMVWSSNEYKNPLRLLSTWSEVCRAEICNHSSDIVVCGLRDGSLAMWDLRETYTFCSKLDGELKHFAATQSIVPSLTTADSKKRTLLDLGAVVDVRSFRAPIKSQSGVINYKSIQFASLNDTGILTVWTLVETTTQLPTQELNMRSNKPSSAQQHKHENENIFEYKSPWARVQLIQSTICDLRAYIEQRIFNSMTSHFEQTKTHFQNNIYSDELLRELNATSGMENMSGGEAGLRFTRIDVGCDRIYVCTNRNYILACTKSLKPARFARYAINESRFLFPTALCVLSNENFVAVGLSNGSVMILNCNQQKEFKTKKNIAAATQRQQQVSNELQASNADVDLVTGKSCAIQNIILNIERRSNHTENNLLDVHETRPTTAACIDLIHNQKRPYELRVYGEQLLLSGSGVRKHLVQTLLLSSDGWRLFALANGSIRVYDFYLERELVTGDESRSGDHIADIASARKSANAQFLVVLKNDDDNEVQLHTLNQ